MFQLICKRAFACPNKSCSSFCCLSGKQAMINHGRGSDGGNKQATNWPRKFSLFPQSCWTMLIMAIMEDMLDSVLQDERTVSMKNGANTTTRTAQPTLATRQGKECTEPDYLWLIKMARHSSATSIHPSASINKHKQTTHSPVTFTARIVKCRVDSEHPISIAK